MNHQLNSEKISILFVIDGLSFGGGERVFAQIVNGLSPQKYRIFIASQPNKHFYQSVNINQVQLFSLDFSKRISLPLIVRLSTIIMKNNIDIVHGQGGRAEFYARFANKLVNRSKYVSTIAMPVEGYDVGCFRKIVYVFLDRFSEMFVDKFLVVSDVLKYRLISMHGIASEKIVRIYNGIEIGHYLPEERLMHSLKIRKEFGLNEETILIGAIGRLVWQKGFEYLIKSVPEITTTLPNAKILIVGEGPRRIKLEALGERLNVKKGLIFTGFRSDIREILSAIDVLVIPSIQEGFPMITLEAMAMAKPIVATNIDGINEQIIDGRNGILITPRDPDALSKAIIRLINDQNLAKNMGTEARKRVEKEFSVENMVFETERVYQSLCQE